jgi:ABC-type spermidine/putrescine transport system permease subunit I
LYGPILLLALLAPFLGLLGIGFAFPLISAVVDSLTGGLYFAEPYVALGSDPVFWKVLARTLEVASLVSLICTTIAYPTAEFIHRASHKVKPFLLALVLIPLWSSTIARTYGWVGVFIRNGALDRLAALFGKPPLQLLYTQTAVIVGMVHVLLPVVLLPVYISVLRYDERLSLASYSLGAGRMRTLFRVKLPVLAPQILAGAIGVFILALGFFITPAVLGSPRSQMVSNLISQQIFQRFDLPRGEAMGIVLVAAVLLMLGLLSGTLQLLRKRLQ